MIRAERPFPPVRARDAAAKALPPAAMPPSVRGGRVLSGAATRCALTAASEAGRSRAAERSARTRIAGFCSARGGSRPPCLRTAYSAAEFRAPAGAPPQDSRALTAAGRAVIGRTGAAAGRREFAARLVSALLCLCAVCAPASALYNKYGIPDSSEIRRGLVEKWFEAPLSAVRMNAPEVMTNRIGEKFEVRLEEAEDSFGIFVAPYRSISMDVYSDAGVQTVRQDAYPGDAPGGWVLVRDKKSGRPVYVRFYFALDSDVFIQFTPRGDQADADFIVYNFYAARSVPSGLKFRSLYSASFDEIMRRTERTMPWQYANFSPDDYHASRQMISVIRERLPDMVFADDAMYDESGRPVYISTGEPRELRDGEKDGISVSSAGFLKWIGDGIVEPAVGGRIRRDPLLVPTVSYKDTGFQGILSESYAVSFALDWVRNLAAAVTSTMTGHTYLYDKSGVDVTAEPFCAEITEKGVRNFSGCVPNTGYAVSALKALLYTLAATEPDTVYFGAIRQTDRKTPEVKVFNECAALFPYFDPEGRFRCAVFSRCEEIPFADFCRRYGQDFIFLTRARCTEQFFPQ